MIDKMIHDNFENICVNGNKKDIEDYVRKYSVDVNYDNGYYLELIVERDNIELLELMLSFGGDVHLNNDSILRSAAHRGNVEMLDYIIKHGGDYNVLFGTSALTNYDSVKTYIFAIHCDTVRYSAIQ
jgi:ankyrin repeat protein